MRHSVDVLGLKISMGGVTGLVKFMFFFCGLGYCLCKGVRLKRRHSSIFCWTTWVWDFGHCVFGPVYVQDPKHFLAFFCSQYLHL